jgi:hypothetical protein
MKSLKHFAIILAGIFILSACQKEYSLESGTVGGLAEGTLKDSLGDCNPMTLRGLYFADSTVNDSNYVIVQVNITAPGSYKIFTDSQNGYSFRDSGFFAVTGPVNVKLMAVGRPILPITSDFTVTFGSASFCLFSVPVLNRGTTTTAEFTLSGTATNCSNAVILGNYVAGTALNNSNVVNIEVDVTTPGTYSILTTAQNGMTFSQSGTFTDRGIQTVSLRGSGTPAIAGPTTIPITAGSSSCMFNVDVTPGAPTDINSADSAWQFTQGGTVYHGIIDSVAFGVVAGSGSPFNVLQLIGFTHATGDTAFVMGIAMTGNTIQSGTYHTNTLAAFNFTNTTNNATIYKADPTTLAPPVVVDIVLTYDAATKIAQGTFSGTALNAGNASIPITAGKFKVLVP